MVSPGQVVSRQASPYSFVTHPKADAKHNYTHWTYFSGSIMTFIFLSMVPSREPAYSIYPPQQSLKKRGIDWFLKVFCSVVKGIYAHLETESYMKGQRRK